MYEYHAVPVRVVDGDTVDLRVDLGFGIYRVDRFRLLGINTPELHSPDPAERLRGQDARVMLEKMLGTGPFVVRTMKDRQEKYGRYLAQLLVEGIDVNAELVRRGLAVPYMVTP